MNDDNKIILILGSITVFGIFSAISYSNYTHSVIAKDAIKAGLVQKIEQNERIWVRP